MFDLILDWEDFKVWLTAATGLSHHSYHLILGIGLTLGLGWIMQRPLGSWTPWLLTFTLELINEVFDFLRYFVPGWPWSPKAALIDIAITMLPVLPILLAARWDSAHFYRFRRR